MGTPKTIAGPAYLAAAVADIYTPPASTMLIRIKQLHIANVTGADASATIYRGATGGSAGGTELMKGKVVPANDYIDEFFTNLVMMSTHFLSGLASAGSTLVITVIGEQDVVP